MKLAAIFARDVTRNIPPVVYFHEQTPEKLAEEVSEYIITGGYADGDPRAQQSKATGIHEQFVRLLGGIAKALGKSGGPELPASWISGFYGSGKSSFAKLLGLALDGKALPDGRGLAAALLARDDSAKAQEFQKVWDELKSQIDPIAVVFDIGAVARDDEQIHNAIRRQLQLRLGYCENSYVADYELKLEQDGKWAEFLACAQQSLGKPWDEVKTEKLAEDKFSAVLHALMPELYSEEMAWIDSRAGSQTGMGSSAEEATQAIAAMLNYRAKDKTLFIVVDEVSQYIFQNTGRMLALQSFVSSLGQRLKGQVWLLATGQQKLEDNEDESNIGKLKDRFPPSLRVHLAPANIKDVVHKRLLKKNASEEPALRQLFAQHRSELKLYGYQCDNITEEDFVEVYPLLPGYVDLVMQIASNLRTRSAKAKGDDYAIRGLLQLLGELFREQRLGEKDLGELITLDQIFEIQRSALDNDVQITLSRIFDHNAVLANSPEERAAKAVALLELIQDQEPTTPALVSQCLYQRLGAGNQTTQIEQALNNLRDWGLLSYSEKTGYKIQSSAGQEWGRERDSYSVSSGVRSELVASKLKDLLGGLARPRYQNNTFRWSAFYNDGKEQREVPLQSPRDLDVVTVDFRYLKSKDDRKPDLWIQESDTHLLKNRLIWVVGETGELDSLLQHLGRSKHMLSKYESRKQSLSDAKKRLLGDEQSNCDRLESKVKDAVSAAFMAGEVYFQGRKLDKQTLGSSFTQLLEQAANHVLPQLYSRYEGTRVDPAELKQLLAKEISGPSQKFMAGGLGILEEDAGKYTPVCNGTVPQRILQYVQEEQGVAGGTLLSHFGGPPYGYTPDLVRACLAGLLRGRKLSIRPESGAVITSIQDAGARDMFEKDRELKRAEVLPPSETGITPRDRISMCKLFEKYFNTELEREDDAIADAVFQYFPAQSQRIRELEAKYNRLPQRPPLPSSIEKLRDALPKCVGARQVDPTLKELKRQLDVLGDGLQKLGIILSELTDERLAAVERAMGVQQNQVQQLQAVERDGAVQGAIAKLADQLALDEPWRDIAALDADLTAIEQHYKEVRLSLLQAQEQAAEQIKTQIQRRSGFSTLSADRAEYVVEPVRKAVDDTTQEALYPELLRLKDSAKLRLQRAAEQANSYLDDALSTVSETEVILFDAQLKHQEIGSPEEVEALVNRLKERLLAQLAGKDNVRIRIQ